MSKGRQAGRKEVDNQYKEHGEDKKCSNDNKQHR